jgi:hypothetical protein
MTLHVAWTITPTVDDIYHPGAITTAADDSLEQVAARLQDKDISALVILDATAWPGSSLSATSPVPWPTGATWPGALPAST